MFAFGLLVGLVLALLVLTIILCFRRSIERTLYRLDDKIVKRTSQGRGEVIFPKDDAEEARERIVKENAKRGRDTTFEELQ